MSEQTSIQSEEPPLAFPACQETCPIFEKLKTHGATVCTYPSITARLEMSNAHMQRALKAIPQMQFAVVLEHGSDTPCAAGLESDERKRFDTQVNIADHRRRSEDEHKLREQLERKELFELGRQSYQPQRIVARELLRDQEMIIPTPARWFEKISAWLGVKK